jgi:transposase
VARSAERFGPWKSVYNRFSNWAKKGHWATIFKELQLEVDETGSIVDGSVIRAHQDASGGKGGSNAMLWAVLEEVFQQSSTPRQRHEACHRLQARTATQLPKSRALYAKRYLVECFFHQLKRFRAIATRFEKTARNFLALTQLACARLWLGEN